MRYLLFILAGFLTVSCNQGNISNVNDKSLVFDNIQSDYKVTDINNYDCGIIDNTVLEHVLTTGVRITPGDEHDFYSTTGCSISGTLNTKDTTHKFTFDYGGIFYIGQDLIIGCAEECCKNEFEYCTWDPDNLK